MDPRLKAMLGYEHREIPNRIEDWGASVHPDDMETVMAGLTVQFTLPYVEEEAQQ